MEKAFCAGANQVFIKCPLCGHGKQFPVEKLHGKKQLKAGCRCGHRFDVHIEMRKAFRKETKLYGWYVNHSRGDKKGELLVLNLSMGGLSFRRLDALPVVIQDQLTVIFQLDDPSRSEVRKKVTVKELQGEDICNCEFDRSLEYAFDKALGFYLMP